MTRDHIKYEIVNNSQNPNNSLHPNQPRSRPEVYRKAKSIGTIRNVEKGGNEIYHYTPHHSIVATESNWGQINFSRDIFVIMKYRSPMPTSQTNIEKGFRISSEEMKDLCQNLTIKPIPASDTKISPCPFLSIKICITRYLIKRVFLLHRNWYIFHFIVLFCSINPWSFASTKFFYKRRFLIR